MSALKPRRRGDDPDDEHALAMIRSMFEAADPVPADLVTGSGSRSRWPAWSPTRTASWRG
jgi:hypothetical protein